MYVQTLIFLAATISQSGCQYYGPTATSGNPKPGHPADPPEATQPLVLAEPVGESREDDAPSSEIHYEDSDLLSPTAVPQGMQDEQVADTSEEEAPEAHHSISVTRAKTQGDDSEQHYKGYNPEQGSRNKQISLQNSIFNTAPNTDFPSSDSDLTPKTPHQETSNSLEYGRDVYIQYEDIKRKGKYAPSQYSYNEDTRYYSSTTNLQEPRGFSYGTKEEDFAQQVLPHKEIKVKKNSTPSRINYEIPFPGSSNLFLFTPNIQSHGLFVRVSDLTSVNSVPPPNGLVARSQPNENSHNYDGEEDDNSSGTSISSTYRNNEDFRFYRPTAFLQVPTGHATDSYEDSVAKTANFVTKTKTHREYQDDYHSRQAVPPGVGPSSYVQAPVGLYQGPLAQPVVLRSGYLADTREVAEAKERHLRALSASFQGLY